VEILTRKKTYLENTYETTSHLAGREDSECESVTICKKAQLICYDQQAKQQTESTATLATNPQRGPANPQRAVPHVSYCNR